jgi:hypothetical protein
MSNMTVKKQQKRKARERRVAQEKVQQAERRRYALAFPEFVLRPNNAPQAFVDLIWRAIRRIDFRDRSLFRPAETTFLRLAKRKPAEVLSVLVSGSKTAHPVAVHLCSFVGQTVFRTIPAEQLRQWIPFHDVQFLIVGKEIVVEFRSLEQAKGQGGTIYFSKDRPTLEIDGRQKVIGWSRHAIERTCERLAPRWDSYLGLGDVFAFFDKCCHFERADLHGGQLGFTFFDVCAQGFFTELFARKVLGEPNGQQSYYRVGYCPAVVEGQFVKATTLLYPGFVGTPEYGAILNSRLGRDDKQRVIEKARQQSREYLEKTGDFSLVKWFHDQGVPQVIQTKAEFYSQRI